MDGHGAEAIDCAASSCNKEEAAMDAYLRSQGLYRKRIAKDGSCLFRAVAEQVLHSQSQHLQVRKSCINYLRENRSQYEAFIEGSYEDYLKSLENPQEWVGQVEISALSLMFKKDFIIYQEPNVPPACVTENGFSEKILLCFSNGNHYDIIYPIGFAENAALCQSIIYELLYEKVLGMDVGKYVVQGDTCDVSAVEEVYGSGGSGSEVEEEVAGNKNRSFADMNGFKSHKDSKRPQRKNGHVTVPLNVLRSLNLSQYRNVEYEVWLKTLRDQQKLDFSIAAGMQYSVGDKCQVRLDPGGKFYNAHIQEVGAENGPVVVFVEELGKKHDVQLKHLKPIPLTTKITTTSTDGWNTVAGKKLKKTTASGATMPFEKDYRGQKGSGKPIKLQVAQAPRPQQAAVNKQHSLSSQPSDQAAPSESKGRSRTPPKVPGRKLERERGEELNYSKRENITFGLTPEERKEKQAIEESKSLYEMQNRDTDAFPALSNPTADQRPTQSTDVFPGKKSLNVSSEKNTRRKSEGEEQKDKASKLAQSAKVREQKVAEDIISKQHVPSDAADSQDSPDLPASAEQKSPTTVPSTPPTATAWTGIPAQIPTSAGPGADSCVFQPQVTSAPFSPLPVSMPAVNQPILPLPQTLSAFQDPLYPGFPLNEKGERATAPPYSYCKNGGDLPCDKNILRFFFNLGIKAYMYHMWPPHSYLYPLHQAYMNMCRMYPNIPVYPQGHWVQESPVNQTEVDTSLLHPGDMRMDTHISQPATLSSPTLVASSVQFPGIAAQIPNQCESEVKIQHPSGDFEDPMASKTIYPHSAFGQGSYMGAVPIAPPFFSHIWYGYPYQGYIENQVVRHNVYVPPQDTNVSENFLPGTVIDNNSSVQGAIKQSLDTLGERKPDIPPLSAAVKSSESSSIPSSFQPEVEHMRVATLHQSLPSKPKDNQVALPAFTQSDTGDTGYAPPEYKETTRKETDAVAIGTSQENLPEEKALRTREESSEDEKEVSNMLSSGRSKNFYSHSYNTRRPRGDKFYQPGRGSYQYMRNDEGWRGQRGRDDGYQYHRNYRGRPNRRRPMGDNYRAQYE
ncbi:OTU domain-containing protein 4 [Rhinophrynus dorsalis]